jgi:Ca2+-binding EF-hand superfamily protein
MAISVFHIFNEFDPSKSGFISYYDFKHAIESKLRAFDIKNLDM